MHAAHAEDEATLQMLQYFSKGLTTYTVDLLPFAAARMRPLMTYLGQQPADSPLGSIDGSAIGPDCSVPAVDQLLTKDRSGCSVVIKPGSTPTLLELAYVLVAIAAQQKDDLPFEAALLAVWGPVCAVSDKDIRGRLARCKQWCCERFGAQVGREMEVLVENMRLKK